MLDPILKSALAHFWFVTIHPFDDGNGRITRAIADLTLARSEGSSQRFYSLSNQIRLERKAYYNILNARNDRRLVGPRSISPPGSTGSFSASTMPDDRLSGVMRKARFWERAQKLDLNERQRLILNQLLDGFEGKLTSSKWAKLATCSQDTAHRDILDLIEKKVLLRGETGGRSTSYELQTG